MKYAIFTGSGQILRTISCPAADLAANVAQGESSLEVGGLISDDSHYIDGGLPVAFTARPSTFHTFDYTTKAWTDPRTLQDLKDAAWERIKAARETHIDAPLTTPYGTFDSGPKDRTNITDGVLWLQTLATPTSIDVTLADNTTATLTTTEMIAVGLLLGQKVQAAHANARVRRAEIEASTTKEQIDAIVW